MDDHSPLAGKARRIADRRIPSDALDWLTQMDMDGDGVCEIVNSSDFPAIYYKRGGQLYGVDLKSVITAAWPELNWWDYTSAAPDSRSVLFCGLSAGDVPGDGVNFTRYLYFDGESLLLYKPDRSHTDHIADATLADPSVPAEVAARAKQLVQRRYDTLAGSAAQYDDWYTDVSFLGAETRYAGLTLEVYSFSQHYHAQKPEKILLAGGTEVDEDGWAILDGDTVLDGPYIVCLMDGGTRRMLEGSMSGDCSTGSPAYYADLTALLAKNNVLRPDALDGGRLNEVMSSSGISFLNWLGQYDDTEQDRALERLSAYRASLTDSYDLDMFSRIVTYLLGDRDGLTDAGRAAQGASARNSDERPNSNFVHFFREPPLQRAALCGRIVKLPPRRRSSLSTNEVFRKHETRILPLPSGLPAGERGLRHRHRQRVALPLHRRQERRRLLRSLLPALPARDGRARADDGTGGRPREPQERRALL